MANVYEAIQAYGLPSSSEEQAWEQVEKGRTGIKSKRKEMKANFKARAAEAMARAKKAQRKAQKKAKLRGKILGGLTSLIPGGALLSGAIGTIGSGLNAQKQAKEMQKYLKQAGGVKGFEGTFLEGAQKDIAKGREEMISSIDSDEALKAGLMSGALSAGMGKLSEVGGDWAKGKVGELWDKMGAKMDSKKFLDELDDKVKEKFSEAKEKMGGKSIQDMTEEDFAELAAESGFTAGELDQFKEWKGMNEGLKVEKQTDQLAQEDVLDEVEGVSAVGQETIGKPKTKYRYSTWEDLNPATSAQDIGKEEALKGVANIDDAKSKFLSDKFSVKGGDYVGGKTLLDSISQSGFGEGGFGKGGLLATLGKKLGSELKQPFTKEGMQGMLGGDFSQVSDVYKGMLPLALGGGFGAGLQGDNAGQYQPVVDQILASLPSDEYYGRR